MDTEIELKFLTSVSAESVLPQLVEQFTEQYDGRSEDKGKVHLINTYFDTPDKQLRALDIGFRIRGFDGRFEQTIKTAGKVVAGLHQRPEYNISLENDAPNLSLFDPAIFPEDCDIELLQADLTALFTTNFYRRKWLISRGDECFELVFDKGLIDSKGEQQVICEVEMELVAGNGELLFEFAEQMCLAFAPENDDNDEHYVRLGFQSKAMRGYQLYNGETLSQVDDLAAVGLKHSDSLECAFIKTVEYGLAYMQRHEQCFIDEAELSALRRFTDGAALIRHAFKLFDEVLEKAEVEHFRAELKWILKYFGWVEHARQLQVLKSTQGKFRKNLDRSEALAQIVDEEADKDPKLEDIKRFFSNPRYIKLMLDLSRFMLLKSWREQQDKRQGDHPEGTLHELAARLLGNAWQSLLQVMPKRQALSIDDYIFHHKQLKRSLMTGISLGGLYDEALRDEFRSPWLDLSRGIDELKTLELMKTLAVKLAPEHSDWILEWLESQIETLLLAMEQSRRMALKMKTYWSIG